MPNVAIENHPLVGTTHTYREEAEPYDTSADTSGGTLVIANGFTCEILSVFKNWNDVADLDMLYVHCAQTGLSTHVTPADLGLPPL